MINKHSVGQWVILSIAKQVRKCQEILKETHHLTLLESGNDDGECFNAQILVDGQDECTLRNNLKQLPIQDRQLEDAAKELNLVKSPLANSRTAEGNVGAQLPIERIQHVVENENFLQSLALFESGIQESPQRL